MASRSAPALRHSAAAHRASGSSSSPFEVPSKIPAPRPAGRPRRLRVQAGLIVLLGSFKSGGGVPSQSNSGGCDQSAAPLKSTVPPENPACLKLTVPPENWASQKLTVPPEAEQWSAQGSSLASASGT
jgi:hypothetical protein